MAKAQVSAAGDVAELVISAPPLNLFNGLESLLEQGPNQAIFEGRQPRFRLVIPVSSVNSITLLGEDVLRCSRIAIRPGRSCARPRRPS